MWDLFVEACGTKFPDQGSNPGPLHQECGVLTTGPPGKSFCSPFLETFPNHMTFSGSSLDLCIGLSEFVVTVLLPCGARGEAVGAEEAGPRSSRPLCV